MQEIKQVYNANITEHVILPDAAFTSTSRHRNLGMCALPGNMSPGARARSDFNSLIKIL
jgi:hypothetical protein